MLSSHPTRFQNTHQPAPPTSAPSGANSMRITAIWTSIIHTHCRLT